MVRLRPLGTLFFSNPLLLKLFVLFSPGGQRRVWHEKTEPYRNRDDVGDQNHKDQLLAIDVTTSGFIFDLVSACNPGRSFRSFLACIVKIKGTTVDIVVAQNVANTGLQ